MVSQITQTDRFVTPAKAGVHYYAGIYICNRSRVLFLIRPEGPKERIAGWRKPPEEL